MKTIQEMLQELSQCIVTVSGEFRFRTNWNGGKVPQPVKPDLDTFDPNVPFCIENVGDVPASVQYNTKNTNIRISKDYKTWNDYTNGDSITLDPTDRVYIKSNYVKDTGTNPRFVFNGDNARLRARGNIASLLYGTGDEYITKYNVATQHCYDYMFANCKSLVQAPELPATTLADYCYDSMFDGCASLTQAPVLPATTLAYYCYGYMFRGCTSLAQAPELPAITLANCCYNFMFRGCTSLAQAPELPATALADYCYSNMFNGCTSLTQAPELPATTLAASCYHSMFKYCTKLNYVKCLATDISASKCTTNWLSGVASTGTFECDNKKYFTLDSPSGIPTGWSITEINPAQPEPEKPDLDVFDPNVPFCIENVGDVQANVQYNTKNTNIKISKDYKTWNDYTSGTAIELNPKDRVYIKSDYVKDTEYNPRFVFNGDSAQLRARGNIASLIYGTADAYVNKYASTEEYCYNAMLKGCTSLIQAPDLPATTLADHCYYYMFYGCTSLVQAPELPATTLANSCYSLMFNGCTSLTQAPELPATTLANNCYYYMFNGCTSLVQAPELPATTLANSCYSYMFQRCTSLTQAPDLPATTLTTSCYESMFYGCASLIQTPALPATTLVDRCYSYMFMACTSLTQAPELPATTLAYNCYGAMFSNCTSLIQVPALHATVLADYCCNAMFVKCTALIQAPDLPATILAPSCYYAMFEGCTSLTQAPELPATTLAKNCYIRMFSGCTSLTQAPELPTAILVESCYNFMFNGCTKLNYVKCLATDTSAYDCTFSWLSGVSSTGTFECDNKKYFKLDSHNGIPKGWTITEINPEPEKPDLDTFDPNVPFCIENVGDVPVEIGMYDMASNIRNTCEISYNNKDWLIYDLVVDPQSPSDIKKIKLTNKGDRVYIKSNHFGTTMSPTPYTRIKVLNESDATKIQARGNIASLNYALYDEYKTKYNSTKDSCYLGLFMSCKSLVKAPDLVATSLSKSCYLHMFKGCTNLKYIKCDATDISASNCTFEWVWGVASKGDFYAPVATNWTTGISGIPQGWTRHDIT